MQNYINTILAAVDFTAKSLNAVEMALHIASRHKARIILFHNTATYTVIDRTGKQVIGADILDEQYKKAEDTLMDLKTSLQDRYPSLTFQAVIKNEHLITGINEVIGSQNVDLVICGTSGKQQFAQLMLGSLSYEILNNANCSVLLVPENCNKYTFDKILVPVRVLEDLSNKIDLSIAIARKNKGAISLLGLSGEEDLRKIKDAYQRAKTNLAISSQDYDAQFLMAQNKAFQISQCSQEDEADIIILNYKDENSWKSFFSENFLKQIINYTNIPLFFMKNKSKTNKIHPEDNLGYDITLPYPG